MRFRIVARLVSVLVPVVLFPVLASAQDSCVPYPAGPSTYLVF
jgi:hypothetical protein